MGAKKKRLVVSMETVETSGHTWQIGHLHLSPVSQNLSEMKLKEQKA